MSSSGWGTPAAAEWLSSEETAGFEAVVADLSQGRGGSRRLGYHGCDCLWVYRPIPPDAHLLLILPFAAIMETVEKAEAAIDWQRPAVEIERRARAFDPFPGASFCLGDERVKLLTPRAHHEVQVLAHPAPPATAPVCLRKAWMNGSIAPSMTLCTSVSFSSVRWSFTIV